VNSPQECSLDAQKKYVYDVMHDTYLWADSTPTLDYSDTNYSSVDQLLYDLKYRENGELIDKWSYISTIKEYTDFFEEGVYIGYGFRMHHDDELNITKVAFVYPSSPADEAGLKRSDEILKIGDMNISEFLHPKDENISNPFGEQEVGVVTQLRVKSVDGSIRDFNMTKAKVDTVTVLHRSVIVKNGVKIGYLVFQSFIAPSREELDLAFKYFKEEGIEELVLDLRYNGGGRVDIANHLASLIGGFRVESKVFTSFTYNRKYQHNASSLSFEQAPVYSVSLEKLVVLGTEDTCSASELVVNSLKASTTGMDVILIGEKTCGKPVGMVGSEFCDKHIAPIEFKIVNADGYGDYFGGMVPECSVSDDLSKDFGDEREGMLEEALYYLENGRCSSNRARSLDVNKYNSLLKGFQREIGAY
jgi:C-terminal processing protease CtpA/Prc